ncbi:DDE_3 domain-containing protein [Trichonephila clavipes]|nr:DDE_3 domain-containing protein [Trichonephila clavipes]
MEWPARSPDLNPIEHLWDYLGREVAALNAPPRSLHELKQGLLCVWSSLPIPVSDNLINSMGNRCRQCIQHRKLCHQWIVVHGMQRSERGNVLATFNPTMLTLGGHNNQNVFHQETLTDGRYCDEILDRYALPTYRYYW